MIDRIAEATNFNGLKLLETNDTFGIQAGPAETSNDVTRITIGDMRASGPNLKITGHTVRTLKSARETMQSMIRSHDIVIEERNHIAAFTNRMEFSIDIGGNIVERRWRSGASIWYGRRPR